MPNAYKKSAPIMDDDNPDHGAAATQTVRIVPANQAAPLNVAAGNSSIFAAGQAAKPTPVPRARLNIDKVVIKKGVPIPALRTGAVSAYAPLLARMEPGDCVELPDRQCHGLTGMAKKLKVPHAARRLGPGVKGFWKLPAAG